MCRVSQRNRASAGDPYKFESTGREPPLRTVEVCSNGERHAYARALVYEIAPGRLALAPFYLREVAGPDIEWDSPACGNPIEVSSPITNLEEARRALIAWASFAVATYAKRHR